MAGVVRLVVDSLLAPSAAFASIRARPVWAWMVIALIVISSALSVYALIGSASPEWIVEQQLQEVSDLKPDEREAARRTLLEIAPYAAHLAAASTAITMPIFCALLALFYFLGERALGTSRNVYGQWFGLSAISLMPMLINALGLIVLCFIQPGDKPLQLANYASLNALVLGLAPGERGHGLAAALSLFYLWNIVLAAIGTRVFSGYGWGKSVLLAALPYLLLFGVWAALV